MLDDRKLAILRAIVTDYVSSQEPVGSRALVERHNLNVSPATVRNDMAALEEEGYITQPHTSAGRIPTDKGYRLFVDRLSTVKPLTSAEKRAITQFMAGALDVDDVVRRTVALLAQITRQVAIVQYPVLSSMVIRHVEVLRLGADRGLVMCVSATGAVEQRLVVLPPEGDGHDDDLALVRGRLADLLVGATPREAVDRLATFTDQLPPAASGDAVDAVPETRWALGLVEAATASSIIFFGSLIARFTPDSMTGRPANRSRSFTPTSVAKIAAMALPMVSAGSGVTPPEPCVSTCTS